MTEETLNNLIPLLLTLPLAVGIFVFNATGNPWTGLIAQLVGDAIAVLIIIFLQWCHKKTIKKKEQE